MPALTAKISRKNQITLPAEVRRHLGVGPSDTIAFVFTERGTVEVRKLRFDLESIIGAVPTLSGASLDFEQEIGGRGATGHEALHAASIVISSGVNLLCED